MSVAVSIKALPPSTVYRIGSSQVLVDSCSVVKELIDNSIDARATSISIEISLNTLDVIQVTDNGHGITPEDRTMVCRRYTTSKISDFSDLVELGGDSLGFRGEALHSLANLSGSLAVTTRVEGEFAAVKLIISRTGEVEERDTASHPIGTSVRAVDFFHNLPVRKQAALKTAPKTLAKIKHMLQAYVLAKPTIRFSLKVLKAKTTTGNFLYAPKAGASSVKDAVFKIFGNNCTSQCSWHVAQFHDFELQALCPNLEAASTKISNIGQFLSVDSRPMTTSRGTMKKIVSLFKEKLGQSSTTLGAVKDPFLCLNIVCPKASYDPNVEPGKDNVLFDDNNKVVAAVTKFFTAIYPVRENQQREMTVPPAVPELLLFPGMETVIADQPMGQAPPEILVLAMSPVPIGKDDFGEDVVPDDEELSSLEQRSQTPAWGPDMYGCDEEDLEILANIDNRPATYETEDPREAAREINPWTIAKMNALLGRTNTVNKPGSFRPVQQPSREGRKSDLNTPLTPVHHDREYQPKMPANTWTPVSQGQVYVRSTLPAIAAQQLQTAAFGLPTPHSSSSPAGGTPLEAIPETTVRTRQTRSKANANKTFVNPLNDLNWGFGPPRWPKKKPTAQGERSNKDIRNAFGSTVLLRPHQEPAFVMQGYPGEEQPNNDTILHEFNSRLSEFEPTAVSTRTMRSTKGVNQPCPVTEDTEELRSPGLRRRSRRLEEARRDNDRTSKVFPSSDAARRTSSKRSRTTEGGKRSRFSHLPLECIPEHQQMHQAILQTRISLNDITTNLNRLNTLGVMGNRIPRDFDAENVYNTFADGADVGIVKIWSRRIKGFLERRLETLEIDDPEEKALACIGALSRLESVEKGVGFENIAL